MNHTYHVTYQSGGREFQESVEAGNPGTAFAHCLKLHPGCKLVKAIVEGRYGSGFGYSEHFPPAVQREPIREPRPARALNKKERGCEFPFYDEVKSAIRA